MPTSATKGRSSPVISPNATADCGPPSSGPASMSRIQKQEQHHHLANLDFGHQIYNSSEMIRKFGSVSEMESLHNNNNNNLTGLSAPHHHQQQHHQQQQHLHIYKNQQKYSTERRNSESSHYGKPRASRSRTDTVHPVISDSMCNNNNYLDSQIHVKESNWIYSPCYVPPPGVDSQAERHNNNSCNNNSTHTLIQHQTVRASPKRRRNVLGSDEDEGGDMYSYKIQRSKNAKIVSTSKHSRHSPTDDALAISRGLFCDSTDINYPLSEVDFNANPSPSHDVLGDAKAPQVVFKPVERPTPPQAQIRKIQTGIQTSPCPYRSDRFFRPIQAPSINDTPSTIDSSYSITVSGQPPTNDSPPLVSSRPSSHIRSPQRSRFIPAENHHRSRKFYRRFLSLNKFLNGTLYRKQNKDDRSFLIHANPLPDSDSDLEFDIEYNVADSDMLTSFNNPNYELNDADALNSNLPASQYYTSSSVYSNSELITDNASPSTISTINSTTNITSTTNSVIDNGVANINCSAATGRENATKNKRSDKRRKKYAQMDLNDALGISSSAEHSQSSSLEDVRSSGENTPVDNNDLQLDSGLATPAGAIVELRHSVSEEPKVTNGQPDDANGDGKSKGGFLGFYASLEMSVSQNQDEERRQSPEKPAAEAEIPLDKKCEAKPPTDINSPDSNDSGIQADDVATNSEKYAKRQHKSAAEEARRSPDEHPEAKEDSKPAQPVECTGKDAGDAELLPPGWQKCTDDDGENTYYWHIKSGKIQREPPTLSSTESSYSIQRSISTSSQASSNRDPVDTSTRAQQAQQAHRQDSTSDSESHHDHLSDFQGHALNFAAASLKSMAVNEPLPNSGPSSAHDSPSLTRTDSSQRLSGTHKDSGPIRFAVRSLGWVRIAEEDLTPERSSRAVNKCIVDLSLGRNDINDVVGRWGDGKDLYMDLDHDNLSLIDPQDMCPLHMQSIQSIRVWGVGRDNGRDFAYVARDRSSRRHMCHVFRCDTPARNIANKLRDICKQIMLERTLAQQQATQQATQPKPEPKTNGACRPSDLPNLEKNIEQKIKMHTSFPTPMEEPKKTLRCHYLGTSQVTKPTGIETLNGAIEKVYAKVPPEKWVFVSMAVAPSTITICEHSNPDNVLAECRMRFLSFMGIAMRNIKLFGFIVHSAQDQFIAHVFHCEPSVGAICKTIQAACMLRYQKCLDSHTGVTSPNSQQTQEQQTTRSQMPGITASLKASVQNVFGKFRRKSDATSKTPVQSLPPEQEKLLEHPDPQNV